MNEQRHGQDEFSLRRSLQQKKRRGRAAAVIALVVLALIFAIWTMVLVLRPAKETPRMAFFRRDWVTESVPARVARIHRGAVLEAPATGIFVPFVREKQSVAAGTLIGAVVPESQIDQINAYRAAREEVSRAYFLAARGGDDPEKDDQTGTGDARMRPAYRLLMTAPAKGDLLPYQTALREIEEAFDRTVLDVSETGLMTDDIRSLEQACADLESALRQHVDPDALLFAGEAGLVRFDFLPGSFVLDEKVWLQSDDPSAQIDRIAFALKNAADPSFQTVEKGTLLGSIDDLSRCRLFVAVDDPVDEVLKHKAGDTVSLYLPEKDELLKNMRVEKAEKNPTSARFVLSCSSRQASAVGVVDDRASFVVARANGWSVPTRSLFTSSDHAPDAVKSGETYGLKIISGGRVYTVRVRVLATDGPFAVVESVEPKESNLPLPSERALYVVNPWTIEEGALIG